MSCASCVGRVESALLALPGVRDVRVNLASASVNAEFDAPMTGQQVAATLRDAGYPPVTEQQRFMVEGLSCASCVSRLEKVLGQVVGVEAVVVNLADATASVTLIGDANLADLYEVAKSAGYPLRPVDEEGASVQDREAQALWRATWLSGILVLPVFLIEMGGHIFPAIHMFVAETIGMQTARILGFLLVGATLLGPGRVFFAKGFPALIKGHPDMNALVAIGTGAAFIYSSVATFFPALLPEGSVNVYFEAAGVIIVLILLGRSLEARAKGQTGAAIRALAGLAPKTAMVLDGTETREVALAELRPGDLIRLRPGERVATDGEVTEGTSFVDEAMLSGEPLPVQKQPGAQVIGGTVNGTGSLTYRATAVGADTVLAQIIGMVRDAQSAKLPIQSLVDKITAWFVPAILVIAVLTFVIWMAVGPSLALAVVAAVSVLIIACPCAMGLATPTSIIVGTGRAAEMGVLFRQGDALQRMSDLKTVVFDKTGTLTIGRPEVAAALPVEGMDEARLLEIAAAVEVFSEHPIAAAIVRAVKDVPKASGFQTTTGLGVRANLDGKDVLVGNAAYLRADGIDVAPLFVRAEKHAGMGETVVFVGHADALVGAIAVADPIREDAASAISALKGIGVAVAMVTGDAELTAKSVAARLGVDHVVAEASPEDKVTAIDGLKSQGPLAFVGDGINDAPALAVADVGVAIGTGTDVAIETADVVLMSPDTQGVVNALKTSKATMRNIRQNLGWAFGYNVLLIPVAAGLLYPAFGLLLSPMLAAGAMALSSVAVVSNALRLKRVGR
ncbi:MAG: copper-translocating P-type ATPase [Silicimonas sp.]|nr:copper-translocating P-type ATPase [Silicimonas sp.]